MKSCTKWHDGHCLKKWPRNTMTHKNGRWAILILTTAILAIVVSLESASAHLSFYSCSLDIPNNRHMLDCIAACEPAASENNRNPANDGASLLEVKGMDIKALEGSIDYGLSLLQQDQMLAKSFSSDPVEKGVFVGKSLDNPSVQKFITFLSQVSFFKQRVFNSGKKIYLTQTKDNTALVEKFRSISSGKEYSLSLAGVVTAMAADGYFANQGEVGIINIGSSASTAQLFAVLVHELIHAAQFSSDLNMGKIYNFNKVDIRNMDNRMLSDSLMWVHSEIEAHLNTYNFLHDMLILPADSRKSLMQNLEIDENLLQTEGRSEYAKYKMYEQHETELINEIVGRMQ